ncbi:MAG: 8-amino-7-oxononanoate synthase [Gammaproteobacteria bacterium]|nr:8-amino-7-oxononanoate synthase [Gammaproteobacteria bacterium]
MNDFQQDIEQRKENSLYRSRLLTESPSAPEMVIEGKRLLAFNSNDYLGLANHPELKKAFIAGAEKWGVGSGSAHLVTGHTTAHHQLEEELAAFTGREKALLFSSGYMANLAMVTALIEKNGHVFEDRLNHASLIDAGHLAAAKMHRYQHADVASLQRMFDRVESPNKMIVTDGVFSMDGDIAPLKQLSQVAQDNDALLAVDDAHGFGVLGETGAGSIEQAGLSSRQVPVIMGTLGKAMGCAGAFIAADEVVIETLIQKARSYIYTTAQPAAIAVATSAALKLLETEAWRRQHLASLVERFKQGASQLGLSLMPSPTAIQPLLAGSSQRAIAWAEQLRQRGILVTAIRPPTVPKDTARLRITLSAAHTEEQVDRLLQALGQLNRDEANA